MIVIRSEWPVVAIITGGWPAVTSTRATTAVRNVWCGRRGSSSGPVVAWNPRRSPPRPCPFPRRGHS